MRLFFFGTLGILAAACGAVCTAYIYAGGAVIYSDGNALAGFIAWGVAGMYGLYAFWLGKWTLEASA